jgi:excisionase family DNA binding protein
MTVNQQRSGAMPSQSSRRSRDDNDEANNADTTLQLLLTVEQAAHKLNIGRSMLYELLQAGILESVRIGSSRRIPADALSDFVARLRGGNRRARLVSASRQTEMLGGPRSDG